MEWTVSLIILAGYVSLFIELFFLHVPSVASNRSIWSADDQVTQFYSAQYQWLFTLPKWQKLLLTNIPLLLIYALFVLPIAFILGETTFAAPQLFQADTPIQLIGMGFILSGRAVTLNSVLTIRKDNTQTAEHFKLHTNRLFGRSRNPGLMGMYGFMFGMWLCIPSMWFLAGLLFYIAYMHCKVKMEEDFLSNRFGDQYQTYLNQTGRYLS